VDDFSFHESKVALLDGKALESGFFLLAVALALIFFESNPELI